MGAASRDNLAAKAVAKSVAGLKRHVAASGDGGRIVTAGDNLRICAEGQLVGGNEFDDAILVLHGIGLDDSILIHHLGLQRNRTGVGGDLSQIVHRPGGHLHAGAEAAAIGTFTHQHGLAGGQADVAAGGVQAAAVLDVFGDEKQRTAVARLD